VSTIKFRKHDLVVADEKMEKTLTLAAKAARTSVPVLLCGESGTGKELFARFIHEKSSRNCRPFVSVNCAAIPEGLLEAELFGFERGAFTGAFTQRIGKFEAASHGTLLLDEISEMPMALQAKLLRALQEGEIDRLGGKGPISVFTRIIATTNKEPQQLVEEMKFRQDLFYRLNVVRIDCEPLRGRKAAIFKLAMSFLDKAIQTHGLEKIEMTPEAMRQLQQHSWPGNIRELANTIERAVLMNDGAWLSGNQFEYLRQIQHSQGQPLRLEDVERTHILSVLKGTDGNRTHAADLLGISVRTLRNKIKLYGAG